MVRGHGRSRYRVLHFLTGPCRSAGEKRDLHRSLRTLTWGADRLSETALQTYTEHWLKQSWNTNYFIPWPAGWILFTVCFTPHHSRRRTVIYLYCDNGWVYVIISNLHSFSCFFCMDVGISSHGADDLTHANDLQKSHVPLVRTQTQGLGIWLSRHGVSLACMKPWVR